MNDECRSVTTLFGDEYTVTHPAPYSDELIPIFAKLLGESRTILDPFAGTGKIHQLRKYGYQTTGVEIEPEWAGMRFGTIVGDALHLPFGDETFDAVVTSPTYSNRMADHHDAKDGSKRHTYKHSLGRDPSPKSSATLQWSDEYRRFHEEAWLEVYRVLKHGGLFVLNISDHIRKGKRQPVSAWHVSHIQSLGFEPLDVVTVNTKRMLHGANSDARVGYEYVWLFQKRAKP